ncbi:replicative DNA helicase [Paenibacillus rhizolycopersici]|uniref:replicative DNA helicase n=1 Tax=Paenibacillus rhizolycopersici TaxID=2780073 RepID=UPI003D2E8B2D
MDAQEDRGSEAPMNYYSAEAEQAVIGSILVNPELALETILTPEQFSQEQHRLIFESMMALREREKTIDVVTLATELGAEVQDIGGVQYLLRLSQSIPSTASFPHHEQIVKDKYLMRVGMQGLKEIASSGVDDPKEFAAQVLEIAENIDDQAQGRKGLKHIGEGIMNHFEVLSDKKYNQKSTGYSTACMDMDRVTGKWQKQTLNIIAARPSVGKTAFALNNAAINGKEGLTVAIFSLEMPELQLYDRMIAAECNIDGERIRNGNLKDEEWEKYTNGLTLLAGLNIYIDDRPGLSIHEVRSEVRRLKKKHPELIVYIDYLQLIKGGSKFNNKNRNEEVGYISSSLKQMARENDCPVIALAQLSRSVEQRQDKRPMLSDLRESGNIEQDADTITFLYRDDYYNQETEKKNIIELIVAKNRNGMVGTVEMANLKQYGKFVPLSNVYA